MGVEAVVLGKVMEGYVSISSEGVKGERKVLVAKVWHRHFLFLTEGHNELSVLKCGGPEDTQIHTSW